MTRHWQLSTFGGGAAELASSPNRFTVHYLPHPPTPPYLIAPTLRVPTCTPLRCPGNRGGRRSGLSLRPGPGRGRGADCSFLSAPGSPPPPPPPSPPSLQGDGRHGSRPLGAAVRSAVRAPVRPVQPRAGGQPLLRVHAGKSGASHCFGCGTGEGGTESTASGPSSIYRGRPPRSLQGEAAHWRTASLSFVCTLEALGLLTVSGAERGGGNVGECTADEPSSGGRASRAL